MQNAVQLSPNLKDIRANGHVDFSIKSDTPEPGVLVNEKGAAVEHKPKTIMVKLDEKATEKITLSRGTTWFVGTTIAVVPVLLLVIVYIVTGAMGYQGNLSKVNEMDARITRLENAVMEIQSLKLTVNNIQNDVGNIRTSQQASDIDRKELLKSMSDVRILLAQKGLENQ